MPTTSYPFYAWVLARDLKPTKVQLVKAGTFSGDHVTATGRFYMTPQLYAVKEAAIKAGWGFVARQEADLKRRAADLIKMRKTLIENSKLD